MPIDKVVNEAPVLDVVVTSEEQTLPDVEIVLEEDGSATVEIGEEESQDVDFYANLADVVDPDVLSLISSEALNLSIHLPILPRKRKSSGWW